MPPCVGFQDPLGDPAHTQRRMDPGRLPRAGRTRRQPERSCALGRGAPGEVQASTGQSVHRLSSAEARVPPVVSPGVPGIPKQGPGRAVPSAAARVHACPQLLCGSVRSLTGQQAEERRHPSALWVGGAQEEPLRRGGPAPGPIAQPLPSPGLDPVGAEGAEEDAQASGNPRTGSDSTPQTGTPTCKSRRAYQQQTHARCTPHWGHPGRKSF